MIKDSRVMVGLGEILWDLLPEGKQLGGAPANFAYHASLLGNQGRVASRVGLDALGEELLHRLTRLGLTFEHIQVDSCRPTGTVQVKVDDLGQPDFAIVEDVAWDDLRWTSDLERLAKTADAVCFGSLAQRNAVSRKAIRRFLEATRKHCLRIFDINLRQSFYSSEVLSESLGQAKILKLNDQELPVVMEILTLGSGNERECATRLIDKYELELVCLTRGERGSLLVSQLSHVEHPGFPVQVADSVGAGDAFTAALAHHWLRGSSLEATSKAANQMGSWVASQVGATPKANPEILEQVRMF